MRFVDSFYWIWIGLGYLIPASVGFLIYKSTFGVVWGVFWGSALRITLAHNIIWSINSICQTVGEKRDDTVDNAGNVAILAIPGYGESWHNNHHHDPTCPNFASQRRNIDIGWLVIRSLRSLGLLELKDIPRTISIQ